MSQPNFGKVEMIRGRAPQGNVEKLNYKDFSGLRLSKETQSQLAPSDTFNKERAIQHLDRIQDQVMQKAKESGDRKKIADADRFAVNLHKEQNFIKYSK